MTLQLNNTILEKKNSLKCEFGLLYSLISTFSEQSSFVHYFLLTRLHFPFSEGPGSISYPAAVPLTPCPPLPVLHFQSSTSSSHSKKWLFVNKPHGSLTLDMAYRTEKWPVRAAKWVMRSTTIEGMPVYIFKIRRSPSAHPSSATAPQRKSPFGGGGNKRRAWEETEACLCSGLIVREGSRNCAYSVLTPGLLLTTYTPSAYGQWAPGSWFTHALSASWRRIAGQAENVIH